MGKRNPQNPQEIRRRIAAGHDRAQEIAREIGESVLTGADVEALREERRRLREELEDMYNALSVLDSRQLARRLLGGTPPRIMAL